MESGKCVSVSRLLLAVLILGFLITSVCCTALFFNIGHATKESPPDNVGIKKKNAEERSVFRSTQTRSFVFANQISVETDKQSYLTGESVNITITNIGIRPIHFSDADSDIKITNLKTGEGYIPSTVLLTSLIASGSSKSIVWNQKNSTEQQVDPGKYIASVSIGQLNGNTTFTIVRKLIIRSTTSVD